MPRAPGLIWHTAGLFLRLNDQKRTPLKAHRVNCALQRQSRPAVAPGVEKRKH